MHNLMADSDVDYFADDTPDLPLGMANAYIRSTVLSDGVTGVVGLDAKGERNAKISIKSVKHVNDTYEDIDFATFNPNAENSNPLTWEIEQNEVVWAFGKTKKGAKDDDKNTIPVTGTVAFKIGISLFTAFVTCAATIGLYKIQKNAAVAQIESAKSIELAAKSLTDNAKNRKSVSIGDENMKRMSDGALNVAQQELLLKKAKIEQDINRANQHVNQRQQTGGIIIEPVENKNSKTGNTTEPA